MKICSTIFLVVVSCIIVLLSLRLISVPVKAEGPGQTTRVSVASDGTQGNSSSYDPAISGDGRYIVFRSFADNLVLSDTNAVDDVFVHDLQTGQTTRVSVASDGTQGNTYNYSTNISNDGRYVVFSSSSSNLVLSDTNHTTDVFVHDWQIGQTTRVSVASDGDQGNSSSLGDLAISDDNRYVVFESSANNLASGDTNHTTDVFVHDRQISQTTRVSVASDGTQALGRSHSATISGNGRYIVFQSSASNLVSGDTNATDDIFVHDQQTGQTTRVSVASDGTQALGNSESATISNNGRYIAFRSFAYNLIPGDTNGFPDIFVHDQQTGQTTRVSVASDGTQGNKDSFLASISGDGRYVAFSSSSSNLVPGDTNNTYDVFVYDRQTGQTTRIVTGVGGVQGGLAEFLTISGNGRYIVFQSSASNLVPGDTNSAWDIFVHDQGVVSTMYSISGQVTDLNTQPISGVQLTIVSAGTGYTATTDATGVYTISNVISGTYTITPSLSGFDFSPLTRSVAVPPDAIGQDFTGSSTGSSQSPVIFIPGVAGSYLVDGAEQLWPGIRSLQGRLSLYPSDGWVLSSEIFASDAIRYFWYEFYGPLLERLVLEGYTEYQVNNIPDRRTTEGCDVVNQQSQNPALFVFAYDWRQNIADTATELKDYIGCVQKFHPNKPINIVTHSMGSLVARKYILDNPANHKVEKLITVGAPWLGSPKMPYVLETGDFGVLTTADFTIKHIVGSFSGVHQLLPSEAYFDLGGGPVLVEDGWDIDGNNKEDEEFTYSQYIELMNKRYGKDRFGENIFDPGDTTQTFHTEEQDDWRNDTTNIEYYHLYGKQPINDTIGKVILREKTTCYESEDLGHYCVHRLNAIPVRVSGDGTVPMLSAGRIGNGLNLNAPDAELCVYTNASPEAVEHAYLTSNPQILNSITSILAGNGVSCPNELGIQQQSVADNAVIELTISGGKNILVTDGQGNSNVVISDTLRGEVPGVTSYILGDVSEMFVMQKDGVYTISFETIDEPSTIEFIIGNSVKTTYASKYVDVNLPLSTTVKLNIISQTMVFSYDIGDNITKTLTSTIVISDAEGIDTIAPTVTITPTIVGDIATTTITAQDTESGVKTIYYSTDGTYFQPYTDTVVVNISSVPKIYAFADDQLMNRSSLQDYQLAGSSDIYLPIILKN